MRRTILAATIAFTATAQAQFQIQDSHSTASLRGIHALGNGVAWASGTEGTILRTTDDGATWQRCTTPLDADKLDFRGIQAFDQNTAIAMSSGKGDLSRLYKTTDACKSWKLVFTNPDKDGFFDALKFDNRPVEYPSADSRERIHGYLVGDPVDGRFVIYESIDSGATWTRWRNDKGERAASAKDNETVFAASNSSLLVPGINGPFAFVTGGPSGPRLFLAEPHSPFDNGTIYAFTTKDLKLKSGETAGGFSVAAHYLRRTIDAELMIVGGDYLKPDSQEGTALMVRSAPTFFPKELAPSTPPHGYRSAVTYDPNTKSWITVGPNGTDISRDDGKNWTALKPAPQDAPDADKNWNALSLPFVVGPKGRIGKLRPDALKP
jgi:hypothetical protein